MRIMQTMFRIFIVLVVGLLGVLVAPGSSGMEVSAANEATVISNSDSTFNPKVDYATSSYPSSVAIADFNGDSHPDLAVVYNLSSTLSIFLNNGNGTFAPRVDYDMGGGSWFVIAADFNGDSYPDLAVVGTYSNTVSVLINNGNGTFAPKVDYPTGNEAYSVAAADLNGDSHPDLVVVNQLSNTVSVLLNNGNGTFAPKVDYATGALPHVVAIADFNGDSHPDLAVANGSDNTVSVLLNNGNGTFATKVDYATGSHPWSVAAADFNGDSHPDLVVANGVDNTVSVLLNNGNGTFATKVDYATGYTPSPVVVGDFNRDGHPDLIVDNYNGNTVSLLSNNGNGTFASKVDYATGSGPHSLAVADLNNDSFSDLVVANYNSNTISVLINNGGSGTSFALTSPIGGEQWPTGSTQNIKWTPSSVTGNVNIFLSRDAGTTWETIILGTPNDGNQDWVVTGPSTALARIKIASVNNPNVISISGANFLIYTNSSGTNELRITKDNLRLLDSFPLSDYDPIAGSILQYYALPWTYGQQLNVPGTLKKQTTIPNYSGTYTQLARLVNEKVTSPGDCISATNALSDYRFDANWIRGNNVMDPGTTVNEGTVIATFFGPNDTYGTTGHAGIFEKFTYGTNNKKTGFWVWDQNWLYPTLGSHAFGLTGTQDVGDANEYYIAILPIQTSFTSTQSGNASSVNNNGVINGVTVNISGSTAPNGTNVTISSTSFGGTSPSGIGAVNLNGAQYYDVNVSSVFNLGNNATAHISISSSAATSNAIMSYWYNGVWNKANNVRISGSTISGDIPVSDLGGTPIVIGTPQAPSVPASSHLSLVLMIGGLAGAIILFAVRKKRANSKL